jgi:hypothetical protein
MKLQFHFKMVTIHRESVAGLNGIVLRLDSGDIPDRELALEKMAEGDYDFVECVGKEYLANSSLFQKDGNAIKVLPSSDIIAVPNFTVCNYSSYNGTYIRPEGCIFTFRCAPLSVTVKLMYINDRHHQALSLLPHNREYNKVELFQAINKVYGTML